MAFVIAAAIVRGFLLGKAGLRLTSVKLLVSCWGCRDFRVRICVERYLVLLQCAC